MTFAEKYEELKTKYAAQADFSKAREDFAAEITLTDADCGGTFYVICKKGRAEMAPYNYYDHTVCVKIGSALLEALLQGKKNAVNEFLLGNLEAEGEPAHALALIDAMRLKRRGRKNTGAPA